MRVGVLEVLRDEVASEWIVRQYDRWFRRQYASITPQAVSVWCRQLGHEVHYATYLRPGAARGAAAATTWTSSSSPPTPRRARSPTRSARLYRRRGTLTVLGGPHATSFPTDSLRFFDLVVHDCDKPLVASILRGEFAPGSVVSSGHLLEEVPSVEERMPEIATASFDRGRPHPG